MDLTEVFSLSGEKTLVHKVDKIPYMLKKTNIFVRETLSGAISRLKAIKRFTSSFQT